MKKRTALLIGVALLLLSCFIWSISIDKKTKAEENMIQEKGFYQDLNAQLKSSEQTIERNKKIITKVEPKSDQQHVDELKAKTEALLKILQSHKNKDTKSQEKALYDDLVKYGIKDDKVIKMLIDTNVSEKYTLHTGTMRSDMMQILVDYKNKSGQAYSIISFDTLSNEIVDVETFMNTKVDPNTTGVTIG